ncbi:hypothetical protein [Pseudorhizobium endolithicum]|nr:hypothetical protein [Pseudorhizobium endolithicum]
MAVALYIGYRGNALIEQSNLIAAQNAALSNRIALSSAEQVQMTMRLEDLQYASTVAFSLVPVCREIAEKAASRYHGTVSVPDELREAVFQRRTTLEVSGELKKFVVMIDNINNRIHGLFAPSGAAASSVKRENEAVMPQLQKLDADCNSFFAKLRSLKL